MSVTRDFRRRAVTAPCRAEAKPGNEFLSPPRCGWKHVEVQPGVRQRTTVCPDPRGCSAIARAQPSNGPARHISGHAVLDSCAARRVHELLR
jgi:hypothetical protein